MQTNQLATIKLYRGYFRFAFRLNTDFTELTDHDYHKAKGAFFQDGYSALVSASDGAGNSAMINVYPGLKGAIRTSWSEDFFQNWNEFYIGTGQGGERAKALYACSNIHAGDDARNMFIRLVNRTGRCMDLHIYFNQGASPKLAAYVQQDNGSFELAWTLG